MPKELYEGNVYFLFWKENNGKLEKIYLVNFLMAYKRNIGEKIKILFFRKINVIRDTLEFETVKDFLEHLENKREKKIKIITENLNIFKFWILREMIKEKFEFYKFGEKKEKISEKMFTYLGSGKKSFLLTAERFDGKKSFNKIIFIDLFNLLQIRSEKKMNIQEKKEKYGTALFWFDKFIVRDRNELPITFHSEMFKNFNDTKRFKRSKILNIYTKEDQKRYNLMVGELEQLTYTAENWRFKKIDKVISYDLNSAFGWIEMKNPMPGKKIECKEKKEDCGHLWIAEIFIDNIKLKENCLEQKVHNGNFLKFSEKNIVKKMSSVELELVKLSYELEYKIITETKECFRKEYFQFLNFQKYYTSIKRDSKNEYIKKYAKLSSSSLGGKLVENFKKMEVSGFKYMEKGIGVDGWDFTYEKKNDEGNGGTKNNMSFVFIIAYANKFMYEVANFIIGKYGRETIININTDCVETTTEIKEIENKLGIEVGQWKKEIKRNAIYIKERQSVYQDENGNFNIKMSGIQKDGVEFLKTGEPYEFNETEKLLTIKNEIWEKTENGWTKRKIIFRMKG